MRQLAAAALAFAYAGGAMAFAPAPSALPATRGVSLRAAGHSIAPQARPTVSLGRKGRAALRMAETMEGRHMPQIIQGGMGVQVCVPCVSQTDAADYESNIHKTFDCRCKCAFTQTCTGARALYSIPQHCLLHPSIAVTAAINSLDTRGRFPFGRIRPQLAAPRRGIRISVCSICRWRSDSSPDSLHTGCSSLFPQVSSWKLAREVARAGELGIISGTAMDIVLVRWLQDGDPGNLYRNALKHFPDQGMAQRMIDKFFIEGGKPADKPYRGLPMWTLDASQDLREACVLGNFCEVGCTAMSACPVCCFFWMVRNERQES